MLVCVPLLVEGWVNGHTLNQGGLFIATGAPFVAPGPKSSSKPPGLERMKSHSKSKKDEMAMEQPKSRAGTRYSPESSCHTMRKQNRATQGTSSRMRMTWRCWMGFEKLIAWRMMAADMMMREATPQAPERIVAKSWNLRFPMMGLIIASGRLEGSMGQVMFLSFLSSSKSFLATWCATFILRRWFSGLSTI